MFSDCTPGRPVSWYLSVFLSLFFGPLLTCIYHLSTTAGGAPLLLRRARGARGGADGHGVPPLERRPGSAEELQQGGAVLRDRGQQGTQLLVEALSVVGVRCSVFGVRCSVFFSVFCFLVFGVPTYSARRVLNGMTSVHAVLSCLPFVLTCPRLPLPNTRWPTT